MKVAAIQFAPAFLDAEKTVYKLNNFLDEASDCDLIVLPELANSGYNFENQSQAFSASESIESGFFTNYLKEKSAEYSCAIVSGICEKEGDKLYNSSIVVHNGDLIGRYRKVHLFMNEKDFFLPGDETPEIYSVNETRFGVQICFDWVFPEAWRSLALKGAQIVCHPSNLVLPYAQKTIPGYSVVNRMFIVLANRVGWERNLTFTGQSMITDTKGNILAQADDKSECVIKADINPAEADDKYITSRNHVFNDRKPHLYDL